MVPLLPKSRPLHCLIPSYMLWTMIASHNWPSSLTQPEPKTLSFHCTQWPQKKNHQHPLHQGGPIIPSPNQISQLHILFAPYHFCQHEEVCYDLSFLFLTCFVENSVYIMYFLWLNLEIRCFCFFSVYEVSTFFYIYKDTIKWGEKIWNIQFRTFWIPNYIESIQIFVSTNLLSL